MARDQGAGPAHVDVDAFAARISALRVSRDCAPEDALATLDAALAELFRAEHDLRKWQEQEFAAGPSGPDAQLRDRDLQLLLSTFRDLPVPALLLDRGGAIRRANRLAAELLGVATAYVNGRPFSAFVELPARAALASHLADVAATGRVAHFDSRLQSGAGSTDVRLALSRVDVPGGHQLLSVLVLSPATEVAGEAPGHDSAAEEEAVVAAARRLDLMARMTRLLLDEESLSEPVALQRAARLLTSEFADWSVIDVVRGGEIRRAVVAGHDDRDELHSTRLLQDLDLRACRLPRDVLDSGNPLVDPLIEDETALGVSDDGNPVLAVLRAGSILCVPLRSQQENLGALTLVRGSDRQRFELSDLGLIEELSDHLALALRTERRYQRRSDAADALQASLLPRALPAVDGLELGVAFHSATEGVEVGGDFYDVFQGPQGWGLVLGDVCGKGEEAAAATATVRHGVRLLGVYQSNPAEMLQMVNNAMVTRQETDRFVTAVSAHLVWQQAGARVTMASAGHPRALVLRADGSVHFAAGGGVPLGIFSNVSIATEEIELFPGDALLLYSDGVTEARRSDGMLYGEERLADVLARARGLPAPALVKAVENGIYEHSGGRTHDDTVLLAVRVLPAPV